MKIVHMLVAALAAAIGVIGGMKWSEPSRWADGAPAIRFSPLGTGPIGGGEKPNTCGTNPALPCKVTVKPVIYGPRHRCKIELDTVVMPLSGQTIEWTLDPASITVVGLDGVSKTFNLEFEADNGIDIEGNEVDANTDLFACSRVLPSSYKCTNNGANNPRTLSYTVLLRYGQNSVRKRMCLRDPIIVNRG